jgi:hypothetical protein
MSIYPSPKTRNGSLNLIFNNTDYIQTASAGGGGSSIAQNDARYLRNSGTVVSSGSTTFNSSVNIAGLATIDNLDISGLLNTKKQADTLVSASFSASQTYSFNDAMIYTLASNDTPMTSLSINDIPTTPLKSYNFTFIIQPITADSPYYLKPNKNVISVNNKSIPLYGLENVSLPATYTYLIQEIKVINTSTTATPSFSAFTNVSGFGYQVRQIEIPNIVSLFSVSRILCAKCHNGIIYVGCIGSIQTYNNDILTIIAGNGTVGYSGDGDIATSALVGDVRGIDFDDSNNIYFTDQSQHVIRKIDSNTGTISTIAGNGTAGDSGYGGLATSALLNAPIDLVFDSAYNLYFGTRGSNVINKIDTSGIMSKIGGTGGAGFSGDGGQASQATMNYVSQLSLYEGNLYFVDGNNNRIRKIDFTTGIITTVVGAGLGQEDGDGGQATLANIYVSRGLTFDNYGNMFIANLFNIRKVDTNGIITTVVGENSTFIHYNFRQAVYLSFNSLGNLLITDNFISVIEVDFINPIIIDYNKYDFIYRIEDFNQTSLFNEVSSTYDASFNNSAIISNLNPAVGQYCLTMNADYYINLPKFFNTIEGFSFCFWLKTTSNVRFTRIIDYGQLRMFIIDNTLSIQGGISGNKFILYSNPNDGIWRHFACIFNHSDKSVKVYVNGNYTTSITLTSFPFIDNTGFLGKSLFDPLFTGSLDDIRLQNGQLTDAEVQNIYATK